MATRMLITGLTLALCIVRTSSGALYEFTLEGTVTYAFSSTPTVGEPCIIRYIADNEDQYPPPGGGLFLASPPIVTFPVSNVNLVFEPVEEVTLRVVPFGTTSDLVHYRSFGKAALTLDVALFLPGGTLDLDVLPLELDLAEVISTQFSVWAGLSIDRVRGRIESYSSVPIPEPSIPCAVLLMGAALGRSARRPALRTPLPDSVIE